MNKATSEESNGRNEEILAKKFSNIIKSLDNFKEITEDNIDSKLNDVIDSVQESKKSLDIFNKSFTTLRGSGISYEEEEEYLSYVTNAKDVFYANKEQEYLLRIYKLLLTKETEYNPILIKREAINDLLNERTILRQELNITENDVLSTLYDLIERQYEDIKKQKNNIDNIEKLTEEINHKNDQLIDLEQDNQKVEILALLREYGMIETYINESTSTFTEEEKASSSSSQITVPETTVNFQENDIFANQSTPVQEPSFTSNSSDIFATPTVEPLSNSSIEEPVEDNEVISVENATNIDLEYIHSKADKVMKRVGEMLGIKTEEKKIVSVQNEELFPTSEPIQNSEEVKKEQPIEKAEIPENPLFNNQVETPTTPENPLFSNPPEENNFWFPSDTPDALNELPDLDISNDNFFANNQMPDLNFPDLKMNFGPEGSEDK